MRAASLRSRCPLLQTIRKMIFFGASALEETRCCRPRRAASEKVLVQVDTRVRPDGFIVLALELGDLIALKSKSKKRKLEMDFPVECCSAVHARHR